MPENTKTYKIGDNIVDIPEGSVSSLLKKYPDAIEMKSFVVENDTIDIPIGKEKAFLSRYPDAKETFPTVKKKDFPSLGEQLQGFSKPLPGPVTGENQPTTTADQSQPEMASEPTTEDNNIYQNNSEPDSDLFRSYKKYLGVPYSRAERDSGRAFDCSSFACKVIGYEGDKSLTAADLYFGDLTKNSKEISRNDVDALNEGDLLFFGDDYGKGKGARGDIGHVGVVVIDKKTGKKMLMESASSLGGVAINELDARVDSIKYHKLYSATPKKINIDKSVQKINDSESVSEPTTEDNTLISDYEKLGKLQRSGGSPVEIGNLELQIQGKEAVEEFKNLGGADSDIYKSIEKFSGGKSDYFINPRAKEVLKKNILKSNPDVSERVVDVAFEQFDFDNKRNILFDEGLNELKSKGIDEKTISINAKEGGFDFLNDNEVEIASTVKAIRGEYEKDNPNISLINQYKKKLTDLGVSEEGLLNYKTGYRNVSIDNKIQAEYDQSVNVMIDKMSKTPKEQLEFINEKNYIILKRLESLADENMNQQAELQSDLSGRLLGVGESDYAKQSGLKSKESGIQNEYIDAKAKYEASSRLLLLNQDPETSMDGSGVKLLAKGFLESTVGEYYADRLAGTDVIERNAALLELANEEGFKLSDKEKKSLDPSFSQEWIKGVGGLGGVVTEFALLGVMGKAAGIPKAIESIKTMANLGKFAKPLSYAANLAYQDAQFQVVGGDVGEGAAFTIAMDAFNKLPLANKMRLLGDVLVNKSAKYSPKFAKGVQIASELTRQGVNADLSMTAATNVVDMFDATATSLINDKEFNYEIEKRFGSNLDDFQKKLFAELSLNWLFGVKAFVPLLSKKDRESKIQKYSKLADALQQTGFEKESKFVNEQIYAIKNSVSRENADFVSKNIDYQVKEDIFGGNKPVYTITDRNGNSFPVSKDKLFEYANDPEFKKKFNDGDVSITAQNDQKTYQDVYDILVGKSKPKAEQKPVVEEKLIEGGNKSEAKAEQPKPDEKKSEGKKPNDATKPTPTKDQIQEVWDKGGDKVEAIIDLLPEKYLTPDNDIVQSVVNAYGDGSNPELVKAVDEMLNPVEDVKEPEVKQEEPKDNNGAEDNILISGLKGGFVASSKNSFDVRSDDNAMSMINNGESFITTIDKNGKEHIVVGLRVDNETGATTSGRDGYSFATIEKTDNLPENINEILIKKAEENGIKLYSEIKNLKFKQISQPTGQSPVADSKTGAIEPEVGSTPAVYSEKEDLADNSQPISSQNPKKNEDLAENKPVATPKKVTNFSEAKSFVDEVMSDFKGVMKFNKQASKDVDGNKDGFIIKIRNSLDQQRKQQVVWSLGNFFPHDTAKDTEGFYTEEVGRKNKTTLAEKVRKDFIRDVFNNFDAFLAGSNGMSPEKMYELIEKYRPEGDNPIDKEIFDGAKARVDYYKESLNKRNPVPTPEAVESKEPKTPTQDGKKETKEGEVLAPKQEAPEKGQPVDEVVNGQTQEDIDNSQLEETQVLLGGEAQKRRNDGFYIKDGVKHTRNDKIKGDGGDKGTVRFTSEPGGGGVVVPFVYKIIESETLQPSHQGGIRNPNHFIPEAQPKNRNDRGSLDAENGIAQNPRFDELGSSTNAYGGAPIVNNRGEVVQGNNRAAGIRLGYGRGNNEYKNSLIKNAETFGFTSAQVEGFKEPVLVREVSVTDDFAIELGNYDVKDLETGGKRRIDPVTVVRRIPFAEKGIITGVVFRDVDSTLNTAIRDNAKKLFDLIAPYLNQSQRNTVMKDGKLTESGAKDFEALINYFIFDNGDVALPDLFENLSHLQKEGLRRSLPYIFSVDLSKSIVPEVQGAIMVLNDFLSSGTDNFSLWATQTDVFNDGKTPKEIYKPLEIAIAKMFNDAKTQKDIKSVFMNYLDMVNGRPGDMFSDAIPGKSKNKAIEELFNIKSDGRKENTGDKGGEKEVDRKKNSDKEIGGKEGSGQKQEVKEESKPTPPKEKIEFERNDEKIKRELAPSSKDKIQFLKSFRENAGGVSQDVVNTLFKGTSQKRQRGESTLAYVNRLVAQIKKNAPSSAPVIVFNDVKSSTLPKDLKTYLSMAYYGHGGSPVAFYLDGKVYIFTTKLPENFDANDIATIWLHEVGVHFGITNIFDNPAERKQLLEKIVKDIGREKVFEAIRLETGMPDGHTGYEKATDEQLGNEYLAFLSRKIANKESVTAQERSVWRKILDWITQKVKKLLGFKITEKDVIDIIRTSIKSNFIKPDPKNGFMQTDLFAEPIHSVTPEGKRFVSVPTPTPNVMTMQMPDGKSINVKPVNADVVNGFYSPLEQVVNDAKQDKMPAISWLNKFSQFRSEEAKWTGLTDWLTNQKGSVSKSDILDFLKNNRIQIVEVVKSDKIENKDDVAQKLYGEYYDDLADSQQEDVRIAIDKEIKTPTKFSKYQLEGEKTNYREVLVTMPSKNSWYVEDYIGRVERENLTEEEAKYIAGEFRKEGLEYNAKQSEKDTFKSTHFSEPNILVHLRMNTRVDANGKKVLFLEEIQSDWGQNGKKEGFKDENEKKIAKDKLINIIKDLKINKSVDDVLASDILEYGGTNEHTEIWRQYNSPVNSRIPTAPFVTETPSWVKLAFKVALKEAVKQNADVIAWTTGEQQNERYDLRKQIDEVTYSYSSIDDLYRISIHKNNNVQGNYTLKENEIEGVLGKEIAKKMINGESTKEYSTGMKSLSGLDLEVGGTGMKAFYGSPSEGKIGIVGGVAEKLFKQEIGTIEIGTSKDEGTLITIRNTEGIKKYSKLGYVFMKGHRVISKQDAYAIIEDGGDVKAVSVPKSIQNSVAVTPQLKSDVAQGLPLFMTNLPPNQRTAEQAASDMVSAEKKARAEKFGIRAKYKKIKQFLRFNIESIKGNLRAEIRRASGDYYNPAIIHIGNRNGAGSIAAYHFEKAKKKIFGTIRGGMLSQVEQTVLGNYLALKRIVEIENLAEQKGVPSGVEHPVSKEEAESIINGIENLDPDVLAPYGATPNDIDFAKIEKSANAFWDTMQGLVDMLEQSEVINAKSAAELKKAKNYARRLFLEHFLEENDSGSSISGIMSLKGGSEGALFTDVEQMLSDPIQRIINIISRTKALKALSEYADNFPNEFVERAVLTKEYFKKAAIAGKTKYIKPEFYPPKSGFETIYYLDKGVVKGVNMEKQLADEFNNTTDEQTGTGKKILGWVSFARALKTGTTGVLSPFFFMKNIFLDTPHAILTTELYPGMFRGSLKFVHDWGSIAKENMKYAFTGEPTGFVKQMIDHGLGMDFITMESEKNVLSYRYALLRSLFGEKSVLLHPSVPTEAAKQFKEKVTLLTRFTELGTRLAVAKREVRDQLRKWKKAGHVPTPLEYDELLARAAFRGRNLVDFAEGGRFVKFIDSFIPYTNVGFQVMRSNIVSARRNPKVYSKKIAEIVLFSTIPVLIAALSKYWLKWIMDDDDEAEKLGTAMWDAYQNDISPGDRARFFNVITPVKYSDPATGKDKFLVMRFPKELLISPLTVAAEDATTAMINGTKYEMSPALSQSLKTFGNEFIDPSMGPPLFTALNGYNKNFDNFYNQKIWNGDEVDPEDEYIPGVTSDAYILAGKKLGVSPVRSERAINNLFGQHNEAKNIIMGLTELFLVDEHLKKKAAEAKNPLQTTVEEWPFSSSFGRIIKPTNPMAEISDIKKTEIEAKRPLVKHKREIEKRMIGLKTIDEFFNDTKDGSPWKYVFDSIINPLETNDDMLNNLIAQNVVEWYMEKAVERSEIVGGNVKQLNNISSLGKGLIIVKAKDKYSKTKYESFIRDLVTTNMLTKDVWAAISAYDKTGEVNAEIDRILTKMSDEYK